MKLEEYFNSPKKEFPDCFIISYYQLKKDKKMDDDHVISSDRKLRALFIDYDDGFFMLETCDNKQMNIIFWAKRDELLFLNENKEGLGENELQMIEKKIFDNWIF